MEDIFGYKRTAQSGGQIASSEFAVIKVGKVVTLVQSVTVNYGQEIRTIFVVGDVNAYWVPGHAMGNIDVASLVGPGGFFAAWKGTKCGSIQPISITGGKGTCGYSTGDSTIRFDGGMLERVSLTIQQGQLEMAQSASVKVASMAVG